MRLQKHATTLLLFGLLSILFGCTKNDGTTLILLGTEYYVEDILNAVPDTLRETFEQHFGEIGAFGLVGLLKVLHLISTFRWSGI